MFLPCQQIKMKIRISSFYIHAIHYLQPIHLCNSLSIHRFRCAGDVLLNSRNRHLELFTAHIIAGLYSFNVNFASYQCQSIIYQMLGIVRPKLSNFDSCATCPPLGHPSATPRHPADPCQTILLNHSILQVTIFSYASSSESIPYLCKSLSGSSF